MTEQLTYLHFIEDTHQNAHLFFKSNKCHSMIQIHYANFVKYSLCSKKLEITEFLKYFSYIHYALWWLRE